MHEAYTVALVASKLPLHIEAVAGDEQNKAVLAGTRSGFLLTYSCNEDQGTKEYNPQMCKNFSKKPVLQLKILDLRELQILICLSDGIITVHDCSQVNFPMICSLQKSKGATLFSADVVLTPDPKAVLCVAVKRKLQLYYWKNKDFLEMSPFEFSCPDIPKAILWCFPNAIAIGVRDEYFLVFLESKDGQIGQLVSLFTTTAGSRAIDPLIFKIRGADIVGFLRDERTVFRNYIAQPLPDVTDITWSDVPIVIEAEPPYLISLLPKNVEIRTFRPSILVQIIDIKARLITFCGSGQLFLGNQSDLWCLSAWSQYKPNIQKLVKDKQYDVAVQLAQLVVDDSEDEKQRRIRELKELWAFHLFCQKKFKEAFALYSEIKTDLFTSELRENINFPGPVPKEFVKADLHDGLTALTAYLSETRTNIARDLERHNKLKPGASEPRLSETQINEMKNLLQIVDTTLLKCYLQTNDMLVSSLLRLPDNNCNVTESERVLLKHKKYSELFLLYQRKRMHMEALELLVKQAKNPVSPLQGIDRIITYLQDLGPKQFDLIKKYASYVLRENPTEGLKIFTEESPNVESLPREQVVDFLRREAYGLVIPYLEHVIYEWSDQNQKFHDALAEQYVTKVKALIADYLQSMPEGHTVALAGQEPGELGYYRKRLLKFLEFSKFYSPELLIAHVPHDALDEERAILLGRSGRHEQAIAIYSNILHDYEKAETYCRQTYSRERVECRDVFLTLLRMYAHPPDNSIIGIMHSARPKPAPNVKLALKVLKSYAPYIDTVKAVELLPEQIKLQELWIALETLLNERAIKRKEIQINRGLFYAQFLQVQRVRARAQSIRLVIDHDSSCTKCKKKIGNSAFARCADGSVVHYYCFKGL